MSYPTFEDECGANAPAWQLPFVFAFWIAACVFALATRALFTLCAGAIVASRTIGSAAPLIVAAGLWVWYWPFGAIGFVIPKVVVLVFGFALYALVRGERYAIAAALFCALLSGALGDHWLVSLTGYPGDWATGCAALAFYGLLTLLPPASGPWLRTLGVVLSAHAVVQWLGLDPLLPKRVLSSGRAVAWVGSHVDLGALLAMAAAEAGPTAWLLAIVPGLAAVGSLGAWLAAAVGLTPRRWRFVAVYVALAFPILPFFSRRPSDVARTDLNRVGFAAFRERPLLGHGPETYRLAFDRLKSPDLEAKTEKGYVQNHAHNDLLEVLVCGGVLGALAYVSVAIPLVLESAPLLALFVVLKFNPLNLVVWVVAALLAGGVYARRTLDNGATIGLE